MKRYIAHINNAGNTEPRLFADCVLDVDKFEQLEPLVLKICSGFFRLDEDKAMRLHKVYKEGYGDVYYLNIDDMNDTDLGFMQFSFLREDNKPKITTLE